MLDENARLRERRILEVLEQVLAAAPHEADSILEDACGNNHELKQAVEAHLEGARHSWSHREQAHGLLEKIGGFEPEPLNRVGPYRILQELGSGGMGQVFLASRDDEVFQKKVAIKLAHNRPGSPLFKWLSRERRILAELDHPNICRILDGGELEDGRPYFVMEYVDGLPLGAFCENLSMEARVRLVLKICDALACAHRHLVIHRDLKPDNILVTEEGEPKLLDFGIARMENVDGDTQTCERRMTLEYASPEQVAGGVLTTQSDVYALGVILYELLAGKRPFQFSGKSLPQIQENLNHCTPQKPSTVAEDPSRARYLKGDFDQILLKALRRDPRYRYPTVESLEEDLNRCLSGHPVLARKGNAGYVLGKFLRRHRLAASAALAALVVSLGFSAALLFKQREVGVQRDRALLAEGKATQVIEFMVDSFDATSPYAKRAEDQEFTASALLDVASQRINHLQDEALRSNLQLVMGQAYRNLGDHDQSRKFLKASWSFYQATPNLDTARAARQLGRLELENGNYQEAFPYLEKARNLFASHFSVEHPLYAGSICDLAHYYIRTGEPDIAEPLVKKALAIFESAPDSNWSEYGRVLSCMGAFLDEKGEMDQAEPFHIQCLQLKEQHLGGNSPALVDNLCNLGTSAMNRGLFPKAEAYFQRAVDICLNAFGEEHYLTVISLNNLAESRRSQGMQKEALDLFRRAAEIAPLVLSANHPLHGHIQDNIGKIHFVEKQYDLARRCFEDALEKKERAYGAGSHQTASCLSNLALALKKLGDLEGCEDYNLKSIKVVENALGATHISLAPKLNNLGRFYLDTGKIAKAESIFKRTLAIADETDHLLHRSTSLLGLARVHHRKKQYESAFKFCQEARKIRQKALPPGHRRLVEAELFYEKIVEEYTKLEKIHDPDVQVEDFNSGDAKPH